MRLYIFFLMTLHAAFPSHADDTLWQPDFSRPDWSKGWDLSGEGIDIIDGAILRVSRTSDGRSIASIRLPVEGSQPLLLRFSARSAPGGFNGYGNAYPRVSGFVADAGGERLKDQAKAVPFNWPVESWHAYELDFQPASGTDVLELRIGVPGGTGFVEVRDLRLLTGKPEEPALSEDGLPIIPGAKAFVYKEAAGERLQIHGFFPEGWSPDDQREAVVFFHGGGWYGGNPIQFANQSRYLADRGLVTFTVEYRTQARGGTPFDCVEDARSAMRWVRAHASQLGIDPNRIVAGGGSAGGHLAAGTALITTINAPADDPSVDTAPVALLLFNPVIDTGPGTGYNAVRLGERATEMSPLHQVGNHEVPPTLIMQGKADTTTPPARAQAFQQAAHAKGYEVVLAEYDGVAHGFFNSGRAYYETLKASHQFLKDQGFAVGDFVLPPHPQAK